MTGISRAHSLAAPGRAIVISDGSIAGLIALAIATEETVRRENLRQLPSPLVWAAWPDDTPPALRESAVAGHAEMLGAVRLDESAPLKRASESDGAWANRILLRAGTLALANGCRRVIWPIQHPGQIPDQPASVDLIADALNRATLLSRLVSLDAAGAGLPEVIYETPFVDLSDVQLADLLTDLSLSPQSCWWWGGTDPLAARQRTRWDQALHMLAA